MILECPANVVTLGNGEVACQDGGGVAVSWLVTPSFDPSQLDPELLAAAFAAGFTVVGTGLLIGIGVRMLLDMVRRG